ncbi:MAG: hypothetical protein U5K75_11800 [Ahrensia sp.]|nr:hypothetical protein [Ahrensia sp.]
MRQVVANRSSTVDEDTATVVGDAISYGLVDTDGSEVILGGDGDGYSRWCDLWGNTIGYGHSGCHASMGGGGFTITGTEADILARRLTALHSRLRLMTIAM